MGELYLCKVVFLDNVNATEAQRVAFVATLENGVIELYSSQDRNIEINGRSIRLDNRFKLVGSTQFRGDTSPIGRISNLLADFITGYRYGIVEMKITSIDNRETLKNNKLAANGRLFDTSRLAKNQSNSPLTGNVIY